MKYLQEKIIYEDKDDLTLVLLVSPMVSSPVREGKEENYVLKIKTYEGSMAENKVLDKLVKDGFPSGVIEFVDRGKLTDFMDLFSPFDSTSNCFVYKFYEFTLFDMYKLGYFSTINNLRLTMKGICETLYKLHSEGYAHRDVKPGNVFYDIVENEFVLGDLETLTWKDDDAYGTGPFVAPEVYENWFCNLPLQTLQQSEIWSLGVMFHFFAHGVFHMKMDVLQELQNQCRTFYRYTNKYPYEHLKIQTLPKEENKNIDAVIKGFLREKGEDRMSLKEAIQLLSSS